MNIVCLIQHQTPQIADPHENRQPKAIHKYLVTSSGKKMYMYMYMHMHIVVCMCLMCVSQYASVKFTLTYAHTYFCNYLFLNVLLINKNCKLILYRVYVCMVSQNDLNKQ